jgi:hypothetical protein
MLLKSVEVFLSVIGYALEVWHEWALRLNNPSAVAARKLGV